jgi:c(7)-type cytochrome triheme protein
MTEMPETSAPTPTPADSPRAARWRRWLALSVLVCGCAGLILMGVSNFHASALSSASQDQRAEFISTGMQESGDDFSKFSHTQTHAALPCLLCHRRESNSPQPALPGHTPCSGCHTQRFNDSRNPICTVCHTDVSSGAVKPFPQLKSFNIKFDHALHTAGAGRPAAGCVTCHKTERRGIALSIPAGLNAHSTCYQCHAPRAQTATGRDISSCSTCHSAGSYLRTTAQANAYKVNFSHAKHSARQRLSCNDCHNIRAAITLTQQVSAPQPLMHHASQRTQSCLSCHNNKRAFGIENFGDCKKCHQAAHFYF